MIAHEAEELEEEGHGEQQHQDVPPPLATSPPEGHERRRERRGEHGVGKKRAQEVRAVDEKPPDVDLELGSLPSRLQAHLRPAGKN